MRAVVAIVLVGCWTSTVPAPPHPAPSPPRPEAVRTRARQLFDAQLAAARAGDAAALRGTFADDAVVLAHRDLAAKDIGPRDWLSLVPSMQVDDVTAVTFEANGNDSAVWLAAQVTLVESGLTATRVTLRFSEVVTAASGWKVIAAAAGEVHPIEGYPRGDTMPDKTDPGELAAAMSRLAASTDAIALPPSDSEHLTVGAVAASALIKGVAIQGEVREIHAGELAILQTHLSDGTRLHVVAMRRDGALRVVLVHRLAV